MIGVSSCLAGVRCTFRGEHNLIEVIKEMVARKEAVMICPEVLGGMSIPRNPCEIRNDKVIDITGEDKTMEYKLGAKRSLEILKKYDIDVVLLKAYSPSCGKNKIYDGSFTHTLKDGDGITCQLLEKNGIIVFNENEIDKFFEFIEKRRVENGAHFKG
ncbi:DUF523 domain-containing protein [Thomasclavelia sp.]